MKLRALSLRLRAGGNTEGQREFAAKDENLTEERERLNRRCIVLKSEMVNGGSSPLRVVQVWRIGDRLLEILAFRDDQIENMEWEFLEERWPRYGCIVHVSAKDDYIQYPTGMGGRLFMDRNYFKEWATDLVELGTDFVAKKDGCEELHSRFMWERLMSVAEPKSLPDYMKADRTKWKGGEFLHVYTDGSWATERTLDQFILGKYDKRVVGAIVLSDGMTWVHRLHVDIDVEVTSAFDVYLICILIANEIAASLGSKVVVHSDCQAAINAANGGYSEGFYNTINAWEKESEVTFEKVKSHPERYKPMEEWTWHDRGIWTADKVAKGEMGFKGRVCASKWVKRIGSRFLLVIEEEDGAPFIGS